MFTPVCHKMNKVLLMNTLKLEGQKYNIKVNTIAPIAASRLMGTVMDEKAMALLSPQAVSPLVAWLCHADCESTGDLFEVGAGWISRVRWERSQGAYFSPEGFSPDEVADAWTKVNDFEGSIHPQGTADTMKAIGGNPHLK